MAEPPAVLVDANVLIAAMLGSATVRRTLRTIITTPCRWFISPELIVEFTDVPLRSKFDGIITPATIDEMRVMIRDHSTLVRTHTVVHACRDPRDNHVLAAALDSHVTYLITGDHDLLALHPFHGISIITPADFLARVTR